MKYAINYIPQLVSTFEDEKTFSSLCLSRSLYRKVKMDMGKIARLINVEYLTYIEMDIIQKFSNMKLIKR